MRASKRKYRATLDVLEFLLQTLLHAGVFFVRDEDEAPPLLGLGVDGKLDGFDLQGRDSSYNVCLNKQPDVRRGVPRSAAVG